MKRIHVFGKRSVPVLRKGMRDGDRVVRGMAMYSIAQLKKDAVELIPDLLASRDAEPRIRSQVEEMLPLIDPVRFPPAKQKP